MKGATSSDINSITNWTTIINTISLRIQLIFMNAI